MRINYFVWFSMTVFLMKMELEVRVVKMECCNSDKKINSLPGEASSIKVIGFISHWGHQCHQSHQSQQSLESSESTTPSTLLILSLLTVSQSHQNSSQAINSCYLIWNIYDKGKELTFFFWDLVAPRDEIKFKTLLTSYQCIEQQIVIQAIVL